MQRASKGEVLVLLAPGFEESDVSTVVRTLRRSGLPVATVGLTAGPVRGAYGMTLAPDAPLSEVEVDLVRAIVLPGGSQGVGQLGAEPRVHSLLRQLVDRGGYVLAVDMAYTVLLRAGVLSESVSIIPDAPPRDEVQSVEEVVVKGNVILSQGPETVQQAALRLVSLLRSGKE